METGRCASGGGQPVSSTAGRMTADPSCTSWSAASAAMIPGAATARFLLSSSRSGARIRSRRPSKRSWRIASSANPRASRPRGLSVRLRPLRCTRPGARVVCANRPAAPAAHRNRTGLAGRPDPHPGGEPFPAAGGPGPVRRRNDDAAARQRARCKPAARVPRCCVTAARTPAALLQTLGQLTVKLVGHLTAMCRSDRPLSSAPLTSNCGC